MGHVAAGLSIPALPHTHFVTLDACHLFLSLGFVVSKMNMMPVWQDQVCTGWHQRPPGRGAEEERAQLHVWEEGTVGAQMLRGGTAVTALPCPGLVPGKMKGPRLGPFAGAPSHPGRQLETMCCSLNP